jgi:uncharacterized protein YprB with RNaseH-like and TPR domain
MGSQLTPIAFDIETTGFETDALVTVVGFSLPIGCRVLLNTGGRSVDEAAMEHRLEETFETTLKLSSHQSEAELLEAVTSFAAESLTPREYLLVAYNGERYRNGFDLPFLRTRYALQDVPWPFVDLPYADVMPIFQHRFNTQLGDGAAADLETVYETLVGRGLTVVDPFETSQEAVTAFEAGDFERLIQHNAADILRTRALASLAERYCGKSDFNLKSLTPTVCD